MGSLIDLTGKRIGRLLVLERARNVGGKVMWSCRCDCGKTRTIPAHNLGGSPGHQTLSCGCFQRDQARTLATKHGRTGTPEMDLFWGARSRAKRKGIAFTITPEHIKIPQKCPIFGVKLTGETRALRASVDRKDPRVGYVPGNVWVISSRANTIKSDATPAELRRLADALEAS